MPAAHSGRSLPVLVVIPGGGFFAGTSADSRTNGRELAEQGVVVVSFNYRIGVFGFFAHPALSKESPTHTSGNYGLMDEIAALKWIQDNIAAFGGDPRSVTISGSSAGGSSVLYLMTSPLARGLFWRHFAERRVGVCAAHASPSTSIRARVAEARGAQLGDDIRRFVRYQRRSCSRVRRRERISCTPMMAMITGQSSTAPFSPTSPPCYSTPVASRERR